MGPSCWAWRSWSPLTSCAPSPSEPTLNNVVILAVIVLIRTVLSFSLEIEIEGVAPWRRAATSGATHLARAVDDARSPTGRVP